MERGAGKACTKCKQWKLLEDYHRCRRESDGRHDACKVCKNADKRVYRATHKELIKKQVKERKALNPERFKEYQRRYYSKPEKKEQKKQYLKKYHKENKDKLNAKTSRYRAARDQRIPKWANLKAIESIYKGNNSPGYHVDHIIPLRGEKVSGLHVEYNLQYLPGRENEAKNNRFYLQLGDKVFYTEKEYLEYVS